MTNNKFTVGDIVKVRSSFLGEVDNVLAYVYECYAIGDHEGVSIITENGVDLGGFSTYEQSQYLEFIRKSNHLYQFKNVIQLDRDFESQIKPLFFCNCDRTGNCGC